MSNVEEKKVKEEKKESYKTQYELSGIDIKNFEKVPVSLSKIISKKTGSVIYSAIANFKGIELKDKRFNGDDYLLVLIEHKYTLADAQKVNKVGLDCFYRPVKGTRKDNGAPFYGLDLFISNSYRPRLFFNDRQIKLLEIANIHLNYVPVESDGTELDFFNTIVE